MYKNAPPGDERIERMREISDELGRLANHTNLTKVQEARFNQLTREFEDLEREQRAARESLVAEAYAGGRVEDANVDRSASHADATAPRRGPQVMFRGDPWEAHGPLDGLMGTVEARGRALKAIETAPGQMPDHARERATRAVEVDADPANKLSRWAIATSQPAYRDAFLAWVRDPEHAGAEWSPAEREAVRQVQTESRAMALGTGSAGGYMVPFSLDPSILISNTGSVNPMREVSRIELTATNEWRGITSAGVTASWDPEAQEVSDDSPTLANPAIFAQKAQAFVPVSIELFEDSNIADQVAVLFLDAKAQLEATAFTTGSGTNQPKGIITALVAAGGGTVIATGTNVLAQADLYANQAALPPRWRPNARWMMNLSILNGFRQLPQATGLNYSIISDATTPPTALGWEVRENSAMDGTLTGAAADYLVLSGDFAQFCIVDRVGMTVEFIPHLMGASGRPTGQRGFYTHWRVGSDVLIADAFRLSNYST